MKFSAKDIAKARPYAKMVSPSQLLKLHWATGLKRKEVKELIPRLYPKKVKTSSHLDTAYNLGVHVALGRFTKLADDYQDFNDYMGQAAFTSGIDSGLGRLMARYNLPLAMADLQPYLSSLLGESYGTLADAYDSPEEPPQMMAPPVYRPLSLYPQFPQRQPSQMPQLSPPPQMTAPVTTTGA